MRPKPYVGVTGFKNVNEIRELTDVFLDRGFLGENNSSYDPRCIESSYIPMLGFICSTKRLNEIESEGRVAPALKSLDLLTRFSPRGAMTCMHYYTTNRRNLAEEVKKLFSFDSNHEFDLSNGLYANNYCRALQINMDWPDLDQIESIRTEFPEMTIILQLPKETLNQDLKGVVNRASNYKELVQYVLIDPSGGLGKEFDPSQYAGFMKELYNTMPKSTIGIAGGLDGNNVEEKFDKIAQVFKEPFCIDAEGRLRSEDTKYIDIGKAQNYVNKAKYAIHLGEKFYF